MRINFFNVKRKNVYEVVSPTAFVLQFHGSLMLGDANNAYIVINFFDEGRNEITVSLFPGQNCI